MKTTNLRSPMTALLVAASLSTAAQAEYADEWTSTNLWNAQRPSAARPAPVVPAPAPQAPAPQAASTPAPAPQPVAVVARPAVATPATPAVAMRSSYRYADTPTTAAEAVSSAPTETADPNPVPQMTQRDKDERLWLSALAGNLGSIHALVEDGANPRIATRYGETALHAAAARGHLQVVDYLIKSGVSIHSRTSNGWTALHHAVRFGHAQVASYLIRAGANPNLQTTDPGHKTPIDIAMDKHDLRMARLLGY